MQLRVMSRYDIAAYVWPSFQHEPRMAHVWTEGDGEWQTVRNARPKFDGHNQPRVPLMRGYEAPELHMACAACAN